MSLLLTQLGAVSNIAGTSSVSFSLTGVLSSAPGAMIAASEPAFTATGTLRGAGAMAASADVAFANTGTLAGDAPLAGSASVAFTLSGTLAASGALAGASVVTFSLDGRLQHLTPAATLDVLGAFEIDVETAVPDLRVPGAGDIRITVATHIIGLAA